MRIIGRGKETREIETEKSRVERETCNKVKRD
jgi:hypothetical protein